jgi:hypothetical protein
MEFSHYTEVPKNMADEVLAKVNGLKTAKA